MKNPFEREIIIEIKSEEVNAGNIESTIEQLLSMRDNNDLNCNILDKDFWVVSIEDQILGLSESWTNPDSDGNGKLFYMWRSME